MGVSDGRDESTDRAYSASIPKVTANLGNRLADELASVRDYTSLLEPNPEGSSLQQRGRRLGTQWGRS